MDFGRQDTEDLQWSTHTEAGHKEEVQKEPQRPQPKTSSPQIS